MDDTKNLVVAIALSMSVLLAWQVFFVEPARKDAARIAAENRKNEEQKDAFKDNIAKLEESSKTLPEVLLDRADVINGSSRRIKIKSDVLHGSINSKGIRFDDLTLAGYRQTRDKNSPEVALLSPQGSKEVYFVEFGWLAADKNISLPDRDTVWSADKDIISVGAPITFSWTNKQGLKFIRKISLDENYMFTIEEKIENGSANSLVLLPYSRINRSKEAERIFFISHEGPLAVFDEILEEVFYDDLMDDKTKEYKDVEGWIGMADKYWLTAVIPPKGSKIDASFSYSLINKQNRFQADYRGSPQTLSSGGAISNTQYFFAGAKKVSLLDEYSEKYEIPLFDRAVDFGWLYFLTKPMFGALKFFNSLAGNFGIAIMMLTVVVKLLMFPLANKSYKSMAQLKKVQPEMMEMKERYKNDRQKLGEETMRFYKDRKINPAAGCLPMLVQIPIFFSLYKVLFITIEMRHAPFYGWIKDLSAPDPTSVFNLFGLFDFEPWTILPDLGAYPLIFGITMIIQQKLNPPPTDPTQAMVMKWMPVLFVFLFAGFPAGLVLYWTWNNILSIIQQWVITREVEEEKPAKSSKKG